MVDHDGNLQFAKGVAHGTHVFSAHDCSAYQINQFNHMTAQLMFGTFAQLAIGALDARSAAWDVCSAHVWDIARLLSLRLGHWT
eukprot:4089243-Pyramimonas_sp.AAC.1